MKAYDSPENFEIIGIFALPLKERKYDSKDITLCRNDDLNTSTQTLATYHHF